MRKHIFFIPIAALSMLACDSKKETKDNHKSTLVENELLANDPDAIIVKLSLNVVDETNENRNLKPRTWAMQTKHLSIVKHNVSSDLGIKLSAFFGNYSLY